jgi:5-methylcytosine-specific restriction endonuclease McrA
MSTWSVTQKPDDVLMRDLTSIVQRDRHTTAELLSHIAEVDRRGLCRAAAYPNMYMYCFKELHMSEDEAFKRIRVARAARDYPVLLEMLGDGRLHLSGALTLVPALTRDTADELLSGAVHKTRAQIELLLAERFPKPDVPTTLQVIEAPDRAEHVSEASMDAPTFELACDPAQAGPPCEDSHVSMNKSEHLVAPGRPVPSPSATPAPSVVPVPSRDRIGPLSAGRYELRTTLDQETHDLLRQLQALLAHAVPSGDVRELLKRALKLAVQDAERRRHAATSKPRTKRGSKNPRHIPADVRRVVRKRDGGQCTYTSITGKRCTETRFLEYDHVHPVARGGQATVAILRLRCRAHNQYEAERTYGAGFMREKRQAAKARAETASMLRGVAIERARMHSGAPGPS